MQTPLNASAVTAGNLLSNFLFEIPQYQREYSWQKDEVLSFWEDISQSINEGNYFLGLIILTEDEDRKYVVDGQQRLITLTLLSTALYFEAEKRGRKALADKIQANFLSSIDYETDNALPRIQLTDPTDNATLEYILQHGKSPKDIDMEDEASVSARIAASYNLLKKSLADYLKPDPFKRLGALTKFISEELYFAVFIHPKAGDAYHVFEVINTRGRGLTTADLLKNYVLSQTALSQRDDVYYRWQKMASEFPPEGNANTFVQYIRHAVTIYKGHILPKDLFSFLADRVDTHSRQPPTPNELVSWLEDNLKFYLQMVDQTRLGPATEEELAIFEALNSLNVLNMRPLFLALLDVGDRIEAMRFILRLVVRRVVVGQLGTGNIERRFSEAAYKIKETGGWEFVAKELADLNPSKEEFVDRLHKRSLNKRTLLFLRRSILQGTITPRPEGHIQFIWVPGAENWPGFEDEASFWGGTIGNTFLSEEKKRNPQADSWSNFKTFMLPTHIEDEKSQLINNYDEWDSSSVSEVGEELAEEAGDIWYGG